MSDHIPFEIQMEIIKRLPIRSLIRARSVSKAWKCVIESSDFIAEYTVHNHDQPQHLLIKYYNVYGEETYDSIVEDDTFPQNKVSLAVPLSVDLLWNSYVVGASCGLVCLFGFYRYDDDAEYPPGEATAVLWNPSIRKSVAIPVPDVDGYDEPIFGFGVCPATSDPKIVKITERKMKDVACSSRWQVKVFSLSSGVWRNSFGNLSDSLADFMGPRSQIYLPNELAFHDSTGLHVFNLCDSLAVLQEWLMDDIIEVWMMENGDSKSFTKVFTIDKPSYCLSRPLEFRWNGELMMRMENNTGDFEGLIAYDPFSEHINDLGIESQCHTLAVTSYTESLILINQLDTVVDDEDDEEVSVEQGRKI
ncbi:putative F-box domain-containing protein [Helianthus annuus]|nr:putative F-box domain-containing protein [Helianthus annuus]KAJ0784716.1 putative F-box domain-containing protein [Helianthus annuus]KAJ0949810.1 putative F-box domain-containing protein [Helianthus annuus]